MRIAKAIVASTLTFIACLVVFDIFLQVSEIQSPMETMIDSEIGPTFIPGKKVSRFNEGFFIGSVNEYGYLGPAYPRQRTGTDYRILLMGDSFVMGMTVFPRHHFARSLEADMGGLIGGTVEALNFGKADFNLSNLYQYYQDFASGFEHDVALFFVDEDDLVPARQMDQALYPTCFVDGDTVRIDYSFRESKKFAAYKRVAWLSAHSAFFRLTYDARKMVARGELWSVLLDKFAPSRNRVRDVPKKTNTAQEWTSPILRELAGDSRNILVIKSDLSPSVWNIVKESGIQVIDLGQKLRELEAEGYDPYYWPITGKSGHWNQRAHGEIGQFLARELFARFGSSGEQVE